MGSHRSGADIATAVNARLERFMPVLTPSGVILGFLLPQVFVALRPYIPWFFAIMTLSGGLKLTAREFGGTLRSPLPILLTLVTSHVVMPLVVLLAASLIFPGEGDTVSGYILVYSVPTAVSGFIWVNMYKGDNALALALILIATILAPILVPGTMSLLMGTKVVLDMSGIALSLIMMVVAPTIVGIATNEISRGKIPHIICPYLNPLAKFCIILIIAANAAAVAPRVRFDDPRVYIIAGVCILFAAMGYCLSRVIGVLCRLSPEKQVTIFFSSGLRNISAAATIANDFFPEAAALPALLGIVFQQTMAAIMGRLLLGSSSKKAAH
ncbi:MAG: bile acid:sodium symporter [Treponema sp.]|jgi:predicted Na+-dependent transporter|nr:bile acid:sodium symporter [Treponema sp.]